MAPSLETQSKQYLLGSIHPFYYTVWSICATWSQEQPRNRSSTMLRTSAGGTLLCMCQNGNNEAQVAFGSTGARSLWVESQKNILKSYWRKPFFHNVAHSVTCMAGRVTWLHHRCWLFCYSLTIMWDGVRIRTSAVTPSHFLKNSIHIIAWTKWHNGWMLYFCHTWPA